MRYADKINNFPYFSQNDERWSEHPYGGSRNMGSAGCGPTSAAMIAKSYGVNITPKEMADKFRARMGGAYTTTVGTTCFPVLNEYGLKVENVKDINKVVDALKKKIPVVGNPQGPCDFTKNGHFIVLCGITTDNKIVVNDPNGAHYEMSKTKTWTPEYMKSCCLGSNMKNGFFIVSDKNGKGSIGNVRSSGTTSGSTTAHTNFPKTNLSDTTITRIGRLLKREQGDDDETTCKRFASHMCNLLEVNYGKTLTESNLNWLIQSSGWYGTSRNSDSALASQGTPSDTAISAIKEVIVQGHRVLPRYVTEFDYFYPYDAYNNDYKDNRSKYIKGQTTVHQQPVHTISGAVYGFSSPTSYTFYCFLGSNDIMGYYSKNYEKYKGDVPWGDDEVGGESTDESSKKAYDSVLTANIDKPLYVLDNYETTASLASQPYHAFVDLTFGDYHFPNIPPNYLRSLVVQDVGSNGTTLTLTLVDRMGDEIEEILYRGVAVDKYITFGHVNGRQSYMIKFDVFNYNISFSPIGSTLVISGIGVSVMDNFKSLTLAGGDSPSDAVKKICDACGYKYDDDTIQEALGIKLSDGTYKKFDLVKENPIDYIHKEIAPYAIRASDGTSGYQFYLDEETTPPKAHFHPIEVSNNAVRTYVYQKGLNTNVISFDISTDFVVTGEGSGSISTVREASVLDPVTKEETKATADINEVSKNVNGKYSHIDSNQNTSVTDVAGMTYGEAVANLNSRMTTAMKTFEANMTIVGDPTVKINEEIRVIILTNKYMLHHTSGRYKIMGVGHTISSGIMTTTLNIVKQGDESGFDLKSYKSVYK